MPAKKKAKLTVLSKKAQKILLEDIGSPMGNVSSASMKAKAKARSKARKK